MPPGLAAPPALDARWQDLCARAKVDYIPLGADRRDHLMQLRVDRCGVTKHRWEAAELVLERRCAGAGAVYDPPAAGESSNDRRGRVLRLARLIAAPGAAAQAAGWDQLERRCRAVGVRCSQQAVYPTAATRPGLTAVQRARGKAAVVAAKKRTRKRLKTRAAALEQLYAADEAADDGAGSLDLAYQLHVAPRRPPGMPGDQDDSMSDSGEVAPADRLGWDRGEWLCAPRAAPTPGFGDDVVRYTAVAEFLRDSPPGVAAFSDDGRLAAVLEDVSRLHDSWVTAVDQDNNPIVVKI